MGSMKAHYNVRLKEHDIYYVSINNIPKYCHDVLHLFIDDGFNKNGIEKKKLMEL